MERRRLGRTGLDVSVLAFNARGLDPAACKDVDLDEARAAFALALDGGVDVVAAPAEGAGREAAADLLRREAGGRTVHILSHVPPLIPHNLPSPHLHAAAVFPGAHIREHTETALKAFGVERLAVQFLPAWQQEWTREGDWLETLQALKREGKIAGLGVAPFDHDAGAACDAAASGQIDCVEVMYNPFDPEAAADLFPRCQEKGVGVVVRSPLYGGALAPGWGEATFAPGDWRAAFFYPQHKDETLERAAGMASEVSAPDATLADLAIRFGLSHPAVSTIGVGMRRRDHVEANLKAVARRALSQNVLDRLAMYKWLC